tara:strand:- start:233 stop:508 length:276 start_codon:yes stop_codon:yes gene_type:complete
MKVCYINKMGNNKLARKIRRKKANKELKEAQKKMADAFSNIGLPDNCTLCQKSFDKKSRDHAMTWMVNVIREQKILTCPECWQKLLSLNKS